MSQFYKPHRNPNWNYGGKNWRLSRGKIDLFVECPRCFYIDNKLGTARPRGYPFSLNAAVDHLLKKEFDFHRKQKSAHPLMKKYGIEAIPFSHEKMDQWRDSLRGGVEYFHEKTGFRVSGGVDDIWQNPKTGELYVVDYKATSKDSDVNLDADWQDGYKRQMEVYQWLLRRNGFSVSKTGYFVYANGRRDEKAFDGKLEFDVVVIPYEGDDSWVEKTLIDIKKILDDNNIPQAGKECEYCLYRNAVLEVINQNKENKNEDKSDTLF
ncbi:hypothetical protein COV42_00700 [Candidatus Campbellbacteria bacterium CG11_big_fil_rev_8_21_14_0_20_44_21]|uniref:PD-(D/E)XK endonuclease-like domain-containing protein n=1 Tax=Candidatus Campbellbacteria bacterium CG22_combo_CG10-13_8_21_14_all_43_18 TaxID=1974530 RepID=A0A2H0DX27_9BACT|nr:MAG: hypothetical protein COW82_00355 [Candidatus Campbellbacteria bacterium CG22_combo_CG10-13_8_21_14_all_43_18]PIR24425.1 MAG: hypothetical protein COV42_00700 [Candidatus Campbellbacteria bacterium CG11_big_fil_rev_8_21_14_0_20_44_21]